MLKIVFLVVVEYVESHSESGGYALFRAFKTQSNIVME